MIVTKLEPYGKTKYKVYLDESLAFVLYKGELRTYQIEEQADLPESVLQAIYKNVLVKRAKLRAMHLLNDMDRTEHQLRTKLKQAFYPEEVIEEAMSYVRSFGYIGDVGYAKRYLSTSGNTKSRKQLYAELCKKGISREDAECAFAESYEEDAERIAIQNILRKKRFDPEHATDSERKKIFGYLARKGFSYDDIRHVIQVSDWNA